MVGHLGWSIDYPEYVITAKEMPESFFLFLAASAMQIVESGHAGDMAPYETVLCADGRNLEGEG